jgi:hypothetical protein
MSDFDCWTCYDSKLIDQGGAEVRCPDCGPPTITVVVKGLGWGLGATGELYRTATSWVGTRITFEGTRDEILTDVAQVRRSKVLKARSEGLRGRNHISSGSIAIEKRVHKIIG